MAGEDNPWVHSCSPDKAFLDIIPTGWPGVDWCTRVVPDPGYEYTLRASDRDLEVEYEECLVGWPVRADSEDADKGFKYPPQKGDKLFVAGRLIADCAHETKPEIHPPAVYIDWYSSNGATVGTLVYLPWWYPSQAVDVNLYPPPRPSPDAVLSYTFPSWEPRLEDIQRLGLFGSRYLRAGIDLRPLPENSPNHLSLRLTGRSDAHNPPIEEDGELVFSYPRVRQVCGDYDVYCSDVPETVLSWSGEFRVGWKVR